MVSDAPLAVDENLSMLTDAPEQRAWRAWRCMLVVVGERSLCTSLSLQDPKELLDEPLKGRSAATGDPQRWSSGACEKLWWI